MSNPQVSVTMDASGALAILLPSAEGGTRTVIPPLGKLEHALRDILQGLARREHLLGSSAAPTQAQLDHAEKHGVWKQPKCAFCRAEAAQAAALDVLQHGTAQRAGRVKHETRYPSGVVVWTLQGPKRSGKRKSRSIKVKAQGKVQVSCAADLGF